MSEYSIPNLPLLPIAQDVPVDAGYWVEGANFPPIGTFNRWHRFQVYRDMYDGDWMHFALRELEVVDNFFASIPDAWADLMLAYPPTLEPANEGLQADLRKALHEAVVDYFRYGVAVLYAYTMAEGEPRIECIDPRLWYPMPAGEGDVILRFQEGRYIDVAVLPVEGEDVAMRFDIAEQTVLGANAPDSGNAALYAAQRVAPFECSLGRMVERNAYPGSEGRSIFTVAREPMYGEWGTSAYNYIASMVFEYSRRASDTAVILSEHAYPLLTQVGEPEEADEDVSMLDSTQGERDDQADRRFRFMRRRGEKHTVPQGVALDYVTWDGLPEAQGQQQDRMMQSIFRHMAMSQTLFGINTENTPTTESGEALRRTYIPTYLKSRELQAALLGAVNGALAALGMPDIEVDWPEPLERIDNDTKGAMPAALGGNSEGVVEGDEEGGEDSDEPEMSEEPDEGGA